MLEQLAVGAVEVLGVEGVVVGVVEVVGGWVVLLAGVGEGSSDETGMFPSLSGDAGEFVTFVYFFNVVLA